MSEDPVEYRVNLLREVQDIILGLGYYGYCRIEITPLGTSGDAELEWVGNPGYTASVGQFIRQTVAYWQQGWSIKLPAYRYLAPEGPGNLVYYELDMFKGKDQKNLLVGGCTDFSGEGGHGRALMECYLTQHHGLMVETRAASSIIDMLVGAAMETAPATAEATPVRLPHIIIQREPDLPGDSEAEPPETAAWRSLQRDLGDQAKLEGH